MKSLRFILLVLTFTSPALFFVALTDTARRLSVDSKSAEAM